MTVDLRIPDGTPFWQSTSIRYTAERPDGSNPRTDAEIFWGDDVRFQVELQNLASSTAAATNTEVKVYFCDPSPTPQWTSLLVGSPLEVGTLNINASTIAQDTNQRWSVAAGPLGGTITETQNLHGCLIAVASCTEAPLGDPPFATGTPATLEAVAQRNINLKQAPPPPPSPSPGGAGSGGMGDRGWFGLGFGVGNPSRTNAHIDLRVRRATKLEAERTLARAFPRTRFGEWEHAEEMGFGVVPIDTPAPRPGSFVPLPEPRVPRPVTPLVRPGTIGPLTPRTPIRAPVRPTPTAVRPTLALRPLAPVTAAVLRTGRVSIPDFDASRPLWASRDFSLTSVRSWSTSGTIRQQLGVMAGTLRPVLLAIQTLPQQRLVRSARRRIAVFIAEQFVHDVAIGGVAYVVYSDPLAGLLRPTRPTRPIR